MKHNDAPPRTRGDPSLTYIKVAVESEGRVGVKREWRGGLLVPSESYPVCGVVLLILCISAAAAHKPLNYEPPLPPWPADHTPPPSCSLSVQINTHTTAHAHTNLTEPNNLLRHLALSPTWADYSAWSPHSPPCERRKVGYTSRAHVLFSGCTGIHGEHLWVQYNAGLPVKKKKGIHTHTEDNRQRRTTIKMDNYTTQSECRYETPEMKQ